MRLLILMLALLLEPALASASLVRPERQYYGPLLALYGVGYKQSLEKDGAWRIVTNSRRVDGERYALHTALYRAAELARDAGFSHVQILGGYSTREKGIGVMDGAEWAKIFARGANSPGRPDGCRSNKEDECYTAPVAEILAIVGTIIGRSGGVRPILYPLPTRASPPLTTGRAVAPPAQLGNRGGTAPVLPKMVRPTPEQIFAARLKAAQPSSGRDPKQGWTVSD